MRMDFGDGLTMRILLVNYRYFISGGPEKYMFNIKSVMEKNGHQVFPFSVRSNKNVFSEYSDYFVEPIGGMDAVYYGEVKKTPKNIAKLLSRSIYSFEVKHAIKKEIKDLKPDLVYIIHFINKLSPSVISGAKEMGVPVVLRLSDYFLLCPRFDFLRNQKICEDCLKNSYFSCIKNRCVKGSFFASLIRVISMKFHRMIHVYDRVDAFVSPSQFLKNKLIQQGFPENKIYCIPTFANGFEEETEYKVGEYGLYFGRIVEEKGVEVAIKAYERLPEKKLIIMGDDVTEEGNRLKEYVKENNLFNISFIGQKFGEELGKIVQGSRFVIIPSIWYDNLPNTALEAFQYGKPIIASNIGSLPELVNEGINGFLFEAGNVEELSQKIVLLDNDAVVLQMGENARKSLDENFSQKKHYDTLISLFSELV